MKHQSASILTSMLTGFIVFCTSCSSSATSTPIPFPTRAISTPLIVATNTPNVTLTPTNYPFFVPTLTSPRQNAVPCQQLLQLIPGVSTSQNVYDIMGYPDWKRDLPTGIAIKYRSGQGKFPHVILLDGVSGIVLLVSVNTNNIPNCPSTDELKLQYDNSVLAISNEMQENLFFENKGVAIMGRFVQIFPISITLAEYKDYQGFFNESLAFTP